MDKHSFFYNVSMKINNNEYIMVIKNASIKMLPLTVVIAFITFFLSIITLVWPSGNEFLIHDVLWKTRLALLVAFPYTLVYLMSNYFSIMRKKELDILSSLSPILSLMVFNVIVDGDLVLGNQINFLRAILVGIVSYEIFQFLDNKFKGVKFVKADAIIDLNLAIKQIFISVLSIGIISSISYIFYANKISLNLDPTKNMEFTNSIWVAIKYTFFMIVPWFIGINGSNVASSAHDKLYQNFLANKEIAAQGLDNFYLLNQSFVDLYVHIGGSGATLCLLLALFLSRKKAHRVFAEVSLIPSLFNINEILIFGFPIVANIQLLIPFLLVPMLFTVLSYGALYFGFIPVVSNLTSWIIPPIINAFISCGGDYRVVVWQIFLIALGTIIYMYFLKKYDAMNTFEFKGNFKFLNRNTLDGNIGESQINILSEVSKAREVLKTLLDGGEFILYFQPILDIKDNKVKKLEALIRINHLEKGIVPPYFLKYFKTLKLLSDIDYWVIKKAFEYQKILEKNDLKISMSINISADTFVENTFVLKLKELLKESQINPQNVILELVEEICLYDTNIAKNKIQELKKIGFKISIDDFGTGYSSLSYLLDLDVDFIKIDRKFVLGLEEEKGKKLLENIIMLSKSVGCETVIEGVETIEQLKLVELYNTDYVQGYYYSKPESFEKILEFVKNHNTEKDA